MIEYNTAFMRGDGTGIHEFFWPVSYREYMEFSDSLIRNYAALVKDAGPSDVSTLPYKIIVKFFMVEATGIFQGDLLRERLKAANREAQIDHCGGLWSRLLKGESPEMPRVLESWKNGPEKISLVKKLLNPRRLKKILPFLNMKKGGASMGNLKIKPVTRDVLERDIIATQRTSPIMDQADVTAGDVVFCRSNRWFRAVVEDELHLSRAQNSEEIEGGILAAIDGLYQKAGIVFGDKSRAYLANFLSEGAAIVRVHYRRLLNSPETLPRTVWTGTGGNIWDLMLRMAVMSRRGEATGFDHATGGGFCTSPVMAFAELWGCTRFITFTDAQKKGAENQEFLWASLDKTFPEIDVVAQAKHLEPKSKIRVLPKFQAENPAIRTIALLPTMYHGERGRIRPIFSDICLADWQMRLAAKLREWGYDVIVKTHPESPIQPPQILENVGARIVSTNFENMLGDIDMVLFDYIYTTTFRTALETNIPMVITDFHDIRWSEEATPLIHRRCSVVAGLHGADNRLEMNWEALKKAIETAPGKANNHEFAAAFFHGTGAA
jgi:hypothetical protein